MFFPVTILSWAVLLSATAAYFSIVGLAELFSAAFYPVMVMGIAIEGGKLLAATIVHRNWHNPKFSKALRVYLISAVIAGMAVTALGIYGFLAKGHIAQEAPMAATALKIERGEQKIATLQSDLSRYQASLAQMDAMVQSLINNDRIRGANGANGILQAQEEKRNDIIAKIAEVNTAIEDIQNELLPLRNANVAVTAKLGPVKYVAELFGWQDPGAAVRLVIFIIMWCFDPLAIVLVISGSIELSQVLVRKAIKEEQAEQHTIEVNDGLLIENEQLKMAITEKDIAIKEATQQHDHIHAMLADATAQIDQLKTSINSLPEFVQAIHPSMDERQIAIMLIDRNPTLLDDIVLSVRETVEASLTPDEPQDDINIDNIIPEPEKPKSQQKSKTTQPGKHWLE